MDRRSFISGAFSALGGFFFPCLALPEGKPNLVFGVLSDTHLRRARGGETPAKTFPTAYWRRALEYFRDNGVDAVVHCGDFAHRGLVCEMQFHAAVWRKVFPDDKGKDGCKVEKLFVTGNHDWIGSTYMNFGAEMYHDPEVRKAKVLATDMAKNWQDAWREPYVRGWHKCVKGYHFFGEHYEDKYGELAKTLKASAEPCGLKGTRPFFVLQHKIPGQGLRNVVRGYPNAVSFFGHWHKSIASDAAIKFDGFPMVQCASLRNSSPTAVPGFKAEPSGDDHGEMRQGMLVRVYDDRIVISRRDFFHNGPLGPDWEMPLGKYDPHPLSKDGLEKVAGAPEFPAGVTLVAARSETGLALKIPAANARASARAYAYDIEVAGDEGRPKLRKCVYAAGGDFAIDSKRARGLTDVVIVAKDLPQGKELTVSVCPVSSLGTCGEPLSAKVSA